MTGPVQTALEADPDYGKQEFTFTFTRSDICTIFASVEQCRQELRDPFSRELCAEVLRKIAAHKEYQASKRPWKGALS